MPFVKEMLNKNQVNWQEEIMILKPNLDKASAT